MNCHAVLCLSNLLHMKNGSWPPKLQMRAVRDTLREGEHPDKDMRARGFGKALCVQCGADVGPTERGPAMLKARKGPKVYFQDRGGAEVQPADFHKAAAEFQRLYIAEHGA